jgi:cell division inhibitor SepF
VFRRILESLGLVEEKIPEEESEGRDGTIEERRERVFREPAGESRVLLCRPGPGNPGRERMAEALGEGKMLILDLRRLDREEGQGVLDFLCGVAAAVRGTVLRAGPGVFLATPRRWWVEIWDASEGEEGGSE